MHLVSAYAFNSAKLPDMHWNQAWDTLSVKGHPLHIDLLPKMVQALCSSMQSILDRLLLGTVQEPFDKVIDLALKCKDSSKWPVDPSHNTDEGFLFVHSSDNPFHLFLDFVLEHIHSNPSIFDTYHFHDTQGCFVHKHTALCAYFHIYHEFVDLLMILAHMSTPRVARGMELGPLWAVNSIDGPHNFYFLSGSCAIICHYLKTQSMTGKDGYVTHFLPKSVSRLFIYLIGPVDYLYVINGKTVNSRSFSAVLRTYTIEHLCIPLTLTPFCQALKAILCAVLHHHEDGGISDDPMDASFGHLTATANSRYGLVYKDLPGLMENVYASAMDLAFRYHSWLGVGSSPPSSLVNNDPPPS
ncbi:hypothetical protein J3R83DRAFT_7941 [Lanmaoa asiatica]|nr:hypothetical protein J3R83DRAFT_7941 [Lanmaoa asiatica]